MCGNIHVKNYLLDEKKVRPRRLPQVRRRQEQQPLRLRHLYHLPPGVLRCLAVLTSLIDKTGAFGGHRTS